MNDEQTILLTGASGYVGGRLLRKLTENGFRVRCLARKPEYLAQKVDRNIPIFKGDVTDIASIRAALEGVDTAYYLVHSMGSSRSFEEQDRHGARNFIDAAEKAGLKRIVYLGGLGGGFQLSSHLASRQEVGRIFRESQIPTIELRAGVIIGSGSLSYELIRSLVEKLPIMTTPKWVRTKTQPISIEDVLEYLVAAARLTIPGSVIYEIGGPDIVSYRDLLKEYARQRGLRRWIIPVPILSPGLSSLWLGLVTPLYARVGRKLIESVQNETVVTSPSAIRDFRIQPRGIREAIERSLTNEDQSFSETRWADARSSTGLERSEAKEHYGARFVETRSIRVPYSPEVAFTPIQEIGGTRGWYFGNWLWRLRGFMDLLLGGVDMRRGRPHPIELRVGDTVDFWRVEAFEANHLLRLKAEMKLPGRAWLQFEVIGNSVESTITQTAIFDPFGIWGRIYWYMLYPIHRLIFRFMLQRIKSHIDDAPAHSSEM